MSSYTLLNKSQQEQIKGLTPFGNLSDGESVFGVSITDETALTPRNLTFQVNEERFFPNISLINDSPDNCVFDLIFLVDYQQKLVDFNEKKESVVTVTVDKRSKKTINIGLTDLEEGRHDLTIIALPSSEGNTDVGNLFITSRANLIVAENFISNKSDLPPKSFDH